MHTIGQNILESSSHSQAQQTPRLNSIPGHTAIMSNENGESPQPPAAREESPITLMLHMQQQQMAMQQQMAQLMSQLAPPAARADRQSETSRPVRAKIERPLMDADCSDNQWVIFQDAWQRYKQMTSLTDVAEIRNELRSACSPKVNEMLFNFIGPDVLNTASEHDLMKHIKSVAVRAVHPEVYRQQFFMLKQSDGESITNFVSRLKAKAMLCDFTTNTSCEDQNCRATYSADMVKSQLIAGTRNPNHQSKVLTEMDALKTLDQVIERLLTLESTERASSHFRAPFTPSPPAGDIGAIVRKPPVSSAKPKPNQPQCVGCGQAFHPKGRSTCPAWKKTCNRCKKPNHFAKVCRSTPSVASIAEEEICEDQYELSTVRIDPL